MKYLITGISGFVGGHYLEYLSRQNFDLQIISGDLQRPKFDFLGESFQKKIKFYKGSLLDKKYILNLIKKYKPDYIVNLASYSSVAYSWINPVECFVNNTNAFLNLAEAVRTTGVKTRILSIGSSEEYGVVDTKDIPLTERSPLNPISPYAVARVAQERLSKVYAAGYKIPIICTRSFNHVGPRQRENFAVSSFAKQIIEAKKNKNGEIISGNLDIIRDFVDVRDVVRAYDCILHKGKVGEVYNVCSGQGYKLSEIIKMLQEKAKTNFPVKVDPNLLRPVDNPVIIGSCEKLEKDIEFKNKYSLSQSLTDVLEYWQNRL